MEISTNSSVARTSWAVAIRLAVGAVLGSPIVVEAATLNLDGQYEVTNPVAAAVGRCAPGGRTVVFGPGNKYAAGSSNLGAFTPAGSHCIKPPLPAPYDSGIITLSFTVGDTLDATYSGALTASGTPGLFDNVQNFVVSGGTGRFLGASGAFTGLGTVDMLGNGYADAKETISGTLNLPAVPEPAAWALMLLGFGTIGAAARSRRRNGLAPAAG